MGTSFVRKTTQPGTGGEFLTRKLDQERDNLLIVVVGVVVGLVVQLLGRLLRELLLVARGRDAKVVAEHDERLLLALLEQPHGGNLAGPGHVVVVVAVVVVVVVLLLLLLALALLGRALAAGLRLDLGSSGPVDVERAAGHGGDLVRQEDQHTLSFFHTMQTQTLDLLQTRD